MQSYFLTDTGIYIITLDWKLRNQQLDTIYYWLDFILSKVNEWKLMSGEVQIILLATYKEELTTFELYKTISEKKNYLGEIQKNYKFIKYLFLINVAPKNLSKLSTQRVSKSTNVTRTRKSTAPGNAANQLHDLYSMKDSNHPFTSTTMSNNSNINPTNHDDASKQFLMNNQLFHLEQFLLSLFKSVKLAPNLFDYYLLVKRHLKKLPIPLVSDFFKIFFLR